MADLCLSRDEVTELCRTPQRRRQAEFLRANGIRHYLDSHDWPVVLRSSVTDQSAAKTDDQTWKPNKAA